LSSELQRDHPGEGGAPGEHAARIGSDPASQLFGSQLDGRGVVGAPEHEVDDVERRITKTRCLLALASSA
jgi:hypothetical protein